MEGYNIIKKEIEEEREKQRKLILDEGSYNNFYYNHIGLKAMRYKFMSLDYDEHKIYNLYWKKELKSFLKFFGYFDDTEPYPFSKHFSYGYDSIYGTAKEIFIKCDLKKKNLRLILEFYYRVETLNILKDLCCTDIANLIMEYV